MDIYNNLNTMINYIESNLDNDIDFNELAKIIGSNKNMTKRFFSLLTNISLTEYIRNRRLTKAGEELLKGDEKIIDIAIKYGYNSPTSFSRAFIDFHGVKPSEIKKGNTTLRVYTKIVFQETKKIANTMDYDIILLEEIVLYGKKIDTDDNKIGHEVPIFFEKIENEYGPIEYGMINYVDRFGDINSEYWALYKDQKEGFEKVIIPPSKWLRFKIDSDTAEEIQNLSHKFYFEFIPSTNFNYRELPELEVYNNGKVDFLVPIED